MLFSRKLRFGVVLLCNQAVSSFLIRRLSSAAHTSVSPYLTPIRCLTKTGFQTFPGLRLLETYLETPTHQQT